MSEKISNISENSELRSFDVLASVRLYQHDLDNLGYIHPETRQRVYDEELSYIAEGINRPNYTEFVIQERDGELVYFHKGNWVPYLSTLTSGLEAAKTEAVIDYRKVFEVERRTDDLLRGYQLQKLKPGEKLSWYYEFPHKQAELYGNKFVEDLGFFPERAMGYLCEAEKTEGQLIIRHQSVDNSDKQAFDAAMLASSGGSIEAMTTAYDSVLAQKNNAVFYAGRKLGGKAPEENAWSALVRHRDLVEYFLDQIEAIAKQGLSETEAEAAKKRLTYGVWARVKERLDEGSIGLDRSLDDSLSYGGSIQVEVQSAYSAAAARGETLFGCGGSIAGENAILNASPKGVFESIFGKKMNCPFCGAQQRGDPCSPNQFCNACTAEVKNRKIVSRGNGGKFRKGFLEILSEELSEWNKRYELEQETKEAEKVARKKGDQLKRAA